MENSSNPIPVPRAVIPPVPLEPLPGETREQMWERLIAEARSDPVWAEAMDRPPREYGRERVALEKNPKWKNFGFRGQVAELLWDHGLEKKAIRFANCGRLARPGRCKRFPLEHLFFEPHGCAVVFCRECADADRRRLFEDYLQVVLSVLRECGVPEGWVLARVNFTLRSDGSEITPDRVKLMNRAVRAVMRKSVGSARGFGMLFVDEVGFEKRGHVRERKACGLNLHCHGIYFGPRLDWECTRDLWKVETEKRFGVPSLGFFIRKVKGLERDPERAVRHALNHMLKYVSKPPAVTPERLASLIAAFNGARHVHSLGLFYGRKPKRGEKECSCPKCRAMGLDSTISFEGRRLPNGGCIPRLVLVEDLRAEGYEDLREARRAAFFAGAGEGAVVSGAGPP